MTSEEFITKLPGTIIQHGIGPCQLQIVENNTIRKAACYECGGPIRRGFRYARSWKKLYKLMVDYLKYEGHL